MPVLHALSLLSSNGTLSVEIVLVLEPDLDGQISILVVFVVITFIEAVVDFVLSEFNIVLEVCEADILSNVWSYRVRRNPCRTREVTRLDNLNLFGREKLSFRVILETIFLVEILVHWVQRWRFVLINLERHSLRLCERQVKVIRGQLRCLVNLQPELEWAGLDWVEHRSYTHAREEEERSNQQAHNQGGAEATTHYLVKSLNFISHFLSIVRCICSLCTVKICGVHVELISLE